MKVIEGKEEEIKVMRALLYAIFSAEDITCDRVDGDTTISKEDKTKIKLFHVIREMFGLNGDIKKDDGIGEISSFNGFLHGRLFNNAIFDVNGKRKVESGEVLKVVREGYALNGTVLREAQVIIEK